MQVAVGSYSGNGVDNRQITGVGFRPDLVMIRARDSTQYAVFRTSAMTGDNSLFFAYAAGYYANRIQSLDADGFTIGAASEVNGSGVIYDWQAFRDNGAGDFAVGYYLGDGTDNRSIAGLGFQPDLIIVKRLGTWYGRWRTASNAGDQAMGFGADADVTDEIQALEADGFQVGLTQNGNGAYYQYFAFKAVAGITAYGSYSGNGGDNRSISGLGFQPDLVWIKRNSSLTRAAIRPSTIATDLTEFFTTNASLADHIQALEADGFQVGLGQNASGGTFRWFAWKVGATTPVVVEKAGAETGAASEASALVVVQTGTDSAAATDAVAGRGMTAADVGAATETATRVSLSVSDDQALEVDVAPRLTDDVLLETNVFYSRMHSSIKLEMMVVPLMVDDVLLAADVRNRDFETAAAQRVIAPAAEVSFL